MRILIVEDDKNIREFLQSSLKAEAFAVDCAIDGEQGSYMARTNDYDIILLDNGLPKKDGLTVCREIRQAEKHMPIIVISVRSELPSKITLLNAGADDYVIKPFSYDELSARIRALLRRPKISHIDKLSIDTIVLDSATQKVLRGGERVYLTRKEFALLEFLLRNKGAVLSRGMIMEHVWNIESDPFSNTVEAHIRNLRKKIETKKKHFIYNIPGRGYKIDVEK
jgi:DNA-binding response OmpR family regulator